MYSFQWAFRCFYCSKAKGFLIAHDCYIGLFVVDMAAWFCCILGLNRLLFELYLQYYIAVRLVSNQIMSKCLIYFYCIFINDINSLSPLKYYQELNYLLYHLKVLAEVVFRRTYSIWSTLLNVSTCLKCLPTGNRLDLIASPLVIDSHVPPRKYYYESFLYISRLRMYLKKVPSAFEIYCKQRCYFYFIFDRIQCVL